MVCRGHQETSSRESMIQAGYAVHDRNVIEVLQCNPVAVANRLPSQGGMDELKWARFETVIYCAYV